MQNQNQISLLALSIMTGMFEKDNEFNFQEIRNMLVQGQFTGTEEDQRKALTYATDEGYVKEIPSPFSVTEYLLTEKGKAFISHRIETMGKQQVLCLSENRHLPAALVMDALATYRSEIGSVVRNLSEGLNLAVLMANCVQKTDPGIFPELTIDNLDKVYGHLPRVVFADSKMTPIDAGTTIGLLDSTNRRAIYIVVIAPGFNQVLVQATSSEAAITKIRMYAPDQMVDLCKQAVRMESDWEDGNSFDKVAFSMMFGFDYDKKDDELLVPEGRVQSTFDISKKLASVIMAEFNRMEGVSQDSATMAEIENKFPGFSNRIQ